MNIAVFHSWWTVVLVVLFIGIVAWAWSGKRRPSFEEAAKMPLEDDVQGRTNVAKDRMSRATDTTGGETGERNNG